VEARAIDVGKGFDIRWHQTSCRKGSTYRGNRAVGRMVERAANLGRGDFGFGKKSVESSALDE
jgi:hypothetical protein